MAVKGFCYHFERVCDRVTLPVTLKCIVRPKSVTFNHLWCKKHLDLECEIVQPALKVRAELKQNIFHANAFNRIFLYKQEFTV